MDFQGFLNDLQDFDYLLKDKAQSSGGQPQEGKKSGAMRNVGAVDVDKGPPRKVAAVDVNGKANAVSADRLRDHDERYRYSRHSDVSSSGFSSFLDEDRPPDAVSEKERGNEYFKQKKFHEAIDCYSRSIALSPTSLAFANRAMAYIKVKRYKQAEDDCTEAINLDDRYVKAYSRRATARRELGKLKGSMEDSDFAMRLEPNNPELKKQYMDTKALYDKEIAKGSPVPSKSSAPGIESADKRKLEVKDTQGVLLAPKKVQETEADTLCNRNAVNNGKVGSPLISIKEIDDKSSTAVAKASVPLANVPHRGAALNSMGDKTMKNGAMSCKQEMKTSVQELTSLAASRAKASATRNITAPKTAYQFEVSWRSLSDDCALQAQLLKTIPPAALPQIFRNALSASMLADIVKCTATFFKDETELSVGILENLVKVPRFDMIIMCLSALDRSEMNRIWDEVFSSKDIMASKFQTLNKLRSKYCCV